MANRFSTSSDYSQTFAYLWEQNQRSMEAAVGRQDARREAELAARDSLVFTKWQEGKISGAELMAHINSRVRQTRYDPVQQKQWQEAAITYGNQIADERAEAAYAQTRDINALIQHYAGRLGAIARGTPERTELAKRLRSLREQRDAEDLRKQASRIARQIGRGDASNKDLLALYREKLKTLPANSPLKQELRDGIAELSAQIRDEEYAVAMSKIDTTLATGNITPQDAAAQKRAVLQRFGIERRDPVRFWEIQEEIRRLEATPAPAAVARLEFDLANDSITPEQYAAQIEQWANDIAMYDQAAAWEMRKTAQGYLESEATPLERPEAFGSPTGPRGYSGTAEVVRRLPGSLKHITQFDSSRYSSTNCAMASGAMLAYAMGARGLTGADLRYLTGDVSGGTNVSQLKAALGRVGVTGMRLENTIAFEQFKQRLMNGAPAVLQGWGGNVPDQLRGRYGDIGHGVFVAGYDAKRDAFLVLDPAGYKSQGAWWPASVVQSFGWATPGYGQALFAPRGTIDPKTLERVGGKIKYISVDEAGRLPSTPQGAGGQFDPGPDTLDKIEKATRNSQRARDRRRMQQAGIEPGEVDTKQEAMDALNARAGQITELQGIVDEAIGLMEQRTGDEETVTLSSTGEAIDAAALRGLVEHLIFLQDGQEMYWTEAIGGPEGAAGAAEARIAKNALLGDAANVNAVNADWAQNKLLRNLAAAMDRREKASSPREWSAAAQEAIKTASDLAALGEGPEPVTRREGQELSPAEGEQYEAEAQAARVGEVLDEGTKGALSVWDRLIETLGQEYATPDERLEAVVELASELGIDLSKADKDPVAASFLMMTQVTTEASLLEDGEAAFYQGKGGLQVIPTQESDLVDEDGQPVRLPDLEALPDEEYTALLNMGYNDKNLPKHAYQGPDGADFVYVIPEPRVYRGVTFLIGGEQADSPAAQDLLKALGIGSKISAGVLLDDIAIAGLTSNQIQALLDQKLLVQQPLIVQAYDRNGKTYWRNQDVAPDGTITYRWVPDNLPFIGREVDIPGLQGHDYYGATNIGGLWYTPVTNPEDMDPASQGLLMQHDPDVSDQDAADIRLGLQAQGLFPQTTYSRDPADPSVVLEDLPGTQGHIATTTVIDIQDQIKAIETAKRLAADNMAMRIDAEDAARMASMTEAEKRLLATENSIDYDTGLYTTQLARHTKGDLGPSLDALKELGIEVGEEAFQRRQLGPEEKPRTFDPMGIYAERGVAAANKAAAEQKKEAEKAKASTLPRLTTPIAQTQPAPRPQSTAVLPQAGAAHATTTRPRGGVTVVPVPITTAPTTTTRKPYVAPTPIMDEDGRTALGGGR